MFLAFNFILFFTNVSAEEPNKNQPNASCSDVTSTTTPVTQSQQAQQTTQPAAEEKKVVDEKKAECRSSGLKTPFTIKFDNGTSFTIYGKLDMLTYYDTTSMYISDWYVYVLPKGTYEGERNSFSMSARGSSFGFKFNFPKALSGGDINAKIEMDFVGGFITSAMATYSPLARMRHAYISWDKEHFSLLLGQSSLVFAPLSPDTGTWIVMGTSGNPWMRLPQIRLTTIYNPWKFEFSIARPMGATQTVTDSVNDIINEGEQSQVPYTIGRFSYSKGIISTGISGVYGTKRIHRVDAVAGINVNKTLNSWMTAYDLKLTTKYIDFQGEAFGGSNLNSFFAGIMQGVNTDSSNAWPIRTIGGWGQFTYKPIKKLYFNVGAGIDDPKNSDLTATQRSYNTTVFGNINYKLTDNWTVSAEPVYIRTGYINGTTNQNLRALLRTNFVF